MKRVSGCLVFALGLTVVSGVAAQDKGSSQEEAVASAISAGPYGAPVAPESAANLMGPGGAGMRGPRYGRMNPEWMKYREEMMERRRQRMEAMGPMGPGRIGMGGPRYGRMNPEMRQRRQAMMERHRQMMESGMSARDPGRMGMGGAGCGQEMPEMDARRRQMMQYRRQMMHQQFGYPGRPYSAGTAGPQDATEVTPSP